MSDPSQRTAVSGSILALVLVAECMDLLDGTIVNVAAPTIRDRPAQRAPRRSSG